MEVQSERVRGRLKYRWVDCVKDNVKEKQLSVEDVHNLAQWRPETSLFTQSGKRCTEKEEGEEVEDY